MRDWVFVVTNSLMLTNGLLGYVILIRNRRRAGPHGERSAARRHGDR